jgi:hypothetical protein
MRFQTQAPICTQSFAPLVFLFVRLCVKKQFTLEAQRADVRRKGLSLGFETDFK